MNAGGALFGTEIYKILPVEDFEKAVAERGLIAS